MNNIALGRYVPLDSKIHRLDPRIKILSMIVAMIAVFIVGNFWAYGFLGIVLVSCILISKLSFKFIYKAMKPMMFMLIFLFVINLFVLRTGTVWFSIGGLNFYSEAFIQTLFIVLRLMMLVMVTTLLTATTAPLDLTLGIEDLLSPFSRFGLPAHEIAMMISIVLRFIPTLIEDTQRIMNAQASRGVDFQDGSIKEKLGAIISMIIPLFISSFMRAEDLADAMEARGYYPGKQRTRYKRLHIRLSDWIFFALTCVVLVCVFLIGKFL